MFKKAKHFLLYPGLALVLLGICLALAGCASKPERFVDHSSLQKISSLCLAEFATTDHVVKKGFSGDAEEDKVYVASLVAEIDDLDLVYSLNHIDETGEFSEKIKDWRIGYHSAVKYLDDIKSDPPKDAKTIGSLVKQSGCEGLMWVSREYRLRLISNFWQPDKGEWRGEVYSHVWVYNSGGIRVLDVSWVDQSNEMRTGREITAEDILAILGDAIDRSINSLSQVISNAHAGKGIPTNLGSDPGGVNQSLIYSLSRGLLALIMAVGGVGLFFGGFQIDSCLGKIFACLAGICLAGGSFYLVFLQGWGSDTWGAFLFLLYLLGQLFLLMLEGDD